MALVRADVYEAPTAVAAPSAAARHQRGPRSPARIPTAIAPATAAVATTHWEVEGISCPPWGRAARKNPPRPTTTVTPPIHSRARQVVAEPNGEDEQQEQQLGREHRLHRTQLTVLQRSGHESELHEAEGKPDEPDPLPNGMTDEARLEGGRLRCRLDANALQHRCERVGECGKCGEDDGYHAAELQFGQFPILIMISGAAHDQGVRLRDSARSAGRGSRNDRRPP